MKRVFVSGSSLVLVVVVKNDKAMVLINEIVPFVYHLSSHSHCGFC